MSERKAYEYMRVVIKTRHVVEELNALGQDGWMVADGRLVQQDSSLDEMRYLLMREVTPDA